MEDGKETLHKAKEIRRKDKLKKNKKTWPFDNLRKTATRNKIIAHLKSVCLLMEFNREIFNGRVLKFLVISKQTSTLDT